MIDVDTRLRETLHRVAESTRTTHRVDGIMFPQPRRRVGIMVAAAVFALVVAAIGIPFVFLNGGADPGSVDVATDSSGTSVASVIDPAWLTVDDDDFAVFEQLRAEGASVHGKGWRPSFRTESVWCMYLEGPGADTTASEFPIERDLTREVIEVECATRNDPARNLGSPPEIFTFCRGVFPRDAYREWTTAGEHQVIEGDLDADRPGFPVVLGWDSDCTSEQLDTSWSVRLTPDLSLEAINRARQVEIAVTGAANTNCFSYEQALALATATRQELGDSWLITETSSLDATIEGACYQPIIDQQWGAIYVLGNDRNTSTTLGSAPTTIAPTMGDDSELRARTGVFGTGGEDGTGELIRLDAPDAPAVILEMAEDIQLAPGDNFDRVIENLPDEPTEMTEEGIMVTLEFHAACSWTGYWVDSVASGDTAAQVQAQAVLDEIPTWPALNANDGGGVIDAWTRNAELAAAGDVQGVLDNAYTNNCTDVVPGQ